MSKAQVKKPVFLDLSQNASKVKSNLHPDDYDQKHPEDAYCEEMGPNARVFRVYLDEALNNTSETVDSWRESLDVLLVFAGLFSAVVITILVEASSNLRHDYAEINAHLLAESNAIQRAIASGRPLEEVPVSPVSPTDVFAPSNQYVWINGLWFTSLTLSLATALFAVLVKQWLKHHISHISGAPRERARILESRRRAVETWHVAEIVGALPVLLHAALFAFFAGLVLFLWPLHTAITLAILVMVCVAASTYIIATFLPLRYTYCPYVTPFTPALHFITRLPDAVITPRFHSILSPLLNLLRRRSTNSLSDEEAPFPSHQQETKKGNQGAGLLSLAESQAVARESKKVDGQVLTWLYQNSSLNPSVSLIVFEALSSFKTRGDVPLTIFNGVSSEYGLDKLDPGYIISHRLQSLNPGRAERFLRTFAILGCSLLENAPHNSAEYLKKLSPILMHLVLHNCPNVIADIESRVYIPISRQTTGKILSYLATNISWEHLDPPTIAAAFAGLFILGSDEREYNVPLQLHPSSWDDLFLYVVLCKPLPTAGSQLGLFQEAARTLCASTLRKHYSSSSLPYFTTGKRPDDTDQRHGRQTVRTLCVPPYAMPYGEHQHHLMYFVTSILASPELIEGIEYRSFSSNDKLTLLWFSAVLGAFGDDLKSERALARLEWLLTELFHIIDRYTDEIITSSTTSEAVGGQKDFLPLFNQTVDLVSKLVATSAATQIQSIPSLLIGILERIARLHSTLPQTIGSQLNAPLNKDILRLVIIYAFDRSAGIRGTQGEMLMSRSLESFKLFLLWFQSDFYSDRACLELMELDGIRFISNLCRRESREALPDGIWVLLQMRAAIILSAFASKGYATHDADICGYLTRSDALVECCSIIGHARLGQYLFDDNTVQRLFTNIDVSTFDEWWTPMLNLAKDNPEKFTDEWSTVFQRGVYQVSRQTIDDLKGSKSSVHPQIPSSFDPEGASLILWNKSHFEWIEALKLALRTDQSNGLFKTYVKMTKKEIQELSTRLSTPLVSTHDKLGWTSVEYTLVASYLDQNLRVKGIQHNWFHHKEVPDGSIFADSTPRKLSAGSLGWLWKKKGSTTDLPKDDGVV